MSNFGRRHWWSVQCCLTGCLSVYLDCTRMYRPEGPDLFCLTPWGRGNSLVVRPNGIQSPVCTVIHHSMAVIISYLSQHAAYSIITLYCITDYCTFFFFLRPPMVKKLMKVGNNTDVGVEAAAVDKGPVGGAVYRQVCICRPRQIAMWVTG